MSIMVNDVFINLPVKDLKKSKEFFRKIGFTFREDFCDDNGCCLVLGEHIYAMLLTEEFFTSFSQAGIANTGKENEVIIAVMMNSPEEMEQVMTAGIEAGGKDRSTPLKPEEAELLQYYRLEDLDGHLWEIAYTETLDIDTNRTGLILSSP